MRTHQSTGVSRLYDPEVAELTPPRRYYVVLTMVEMHMSSVDAAFSGLFGRLGEEPVQLVNTTDVDTIRKYRDLWMAKRKPEAEKGIAAFFAEVIEGTTAYNDKVNKWRGELYKKWLWAHCCHQDLPIELLREIWKGQNRQAWGFYAVANLPPSDTSIDWMAREVDPEHWWVKQAHKSMPKFEPVFMFRHCDQMCGLPGDKEYDRHRRWERARAKAKQSVRGGGVFWGRGM